MEHINLDGREVFQDENAMPFSPNNSVELEQDDHSGFTVSEFKMKSERMGSKLPLLLDVKQENNRERCRRKSCPCGNKLTFPNYIRSVSANKNPRGHCISLAEHRTSDPLSIFHKIATFFNIPVNLRSSEFSFESRKNERRTRSISDVGDLFLECSSASGTGDVIISPSGRWLFDSVVGNLKARAHLESSLFCQLGVLDGKMSQLKSRSANTRLIKSTELSSFPSEHCKTSLQKPRVELVPFGKQRSELNISERKLVSRSSANSTCSYQSTSSTNFSFSKGLLYCVWKGGIPYFVFSLDNDCGEVYMANPQKIESSVDKALDYMYLFRMRTDSKRDSGSHYNNASGFVGKMKVSSSIVLNSNKSKLMETEFVLFGCHEDYSREMQSSSSTLTKSKGLSKKVAQIFRSSHTFKHKSTCKIGEPNFQFDNIIREMFVGDLRDLDELDHVNHLAQDFPPNLELAAIVVKDYQHDRNKEVAVGGWGLKFLDKVEVGNADTSLEPSFSCKICKGSRTRNCGDSTRRMNVLVPASYHGGPINRTGGPSSLTERWRSGGHCDCGGWDLGCPLTVLNIKSICSKASPQEESEKDCKSVNLFLEGTRHGVPTLRMMNTSKGLYLIYFQSTLSALQSFSIAVAIIHSQTPDLYPKL